MNKRSHLHKKPDSSASNPVRSQFQSRPNIAQAKPKSEKPLTQTETENQEFQQQKFEATKLDLQAKYGTITPEGQERLTQVQAKMSGLLQRRLEQAPSNGSNLASIPISRPDAPSQQARQETPTPVQAKLTIGEPGDKYEREADAIANKVMSMSAVAPPQMGTPEQRHSQVRSQPLAAKITPLVQHKEIPQSDRPLQGAGDFESRLRRSKGGGSPLPKNVQAYMAPRLGADLSDRRVHTGKEAVQMNQEIGALAFTHGNDIYYGAGQSPRNDHLTAHEVAHTFQQTGGVVQRSPYAVQRYTEDNEGKLSDGKEVFLSRSGTLYATEAQVEKANITFKEAPIIFKADQGEKYLDLPKVKVEKKNLEEEKETDRGENTTRSANEDADNFEKISKNDIKLAAAFIQVIAGEIGEEDGINKGYKWIEKANNNTFTKKVLWPEDENVNNSDFRLCYEGLANEPEKLKAALERSVDYLLKVADSDKLLLPSDCGLFAGMLMSIQDRKTLDEDGDEVDIGLQEPDERVTKVTEKAVAPGQAYYVKGELDQEKGVVFHWATVVMVDQGDDVTMEGEVGLHTDFPKMALDNTWRFLMHGTKKENETFKERTADYFQKGSEIEFGRYEKKKGE